MRGIATQARFLMEDHGEALEPDARRRLNRMQELCGQLESLVSTLLKYSRIGRSDAQEDVDPAQIVNSIITSLSETLAEKNARIVVETRLPEITANPSDVATVLQNLIVNGLTYNDAGEKQVAVGFQEEAIVNGSKMLDVFYVRDNGIGIDAEFQDDVFRMFKRLHQPDAYGEGSGAGLAFVKKVIESNGGALRLVSAPGRGSTFYFSFTEQPLAKAVAADHSQLEPRHA